MAGAYPTPVVTTGIQAGHGSIPDMLQGDVDALKQEINDLRATVGSLAMEIEELKKVKVEAAVLRVSTTPIRVKSEPLEAALGVYSEEPPDPTEPEDVLDREMEVTSQDTGDVGEQAASVPPRRQSTEEPTWIAPAWGETLFRVNPEHAQRIARANEIVAPPIRAPTPPPQPREETPPAPVVRPTKAIGIIPASQAKRKHNFELIIETPPKRFKASNHPTPNSSKRSVASSSSVTLDASSAAAVAPAPVKPRRRSAKDSFRKFRSTPFVVDLNPKIRDVAVSRNFMRSYFGAHKRHRFSEPEQDRVDNHGYDHFVFINKDVNPQAPSGPGQPGIITRFDEKPWPKYDQYRIFRRTNVSPAKWQYIGLYKATKLPAWTPEEMKRQMAGIKTYWAVTVRKSKWARPMLARIMLRKGFGREPTKKEVNGLIEKLTSKSVPVPSLDTIIAAFENGEEKLYPWKLQCQDYEDNLQWEIAITFPGYEKEMEKSHTTANT